MHDHSHGPHHHHHHGNGEYHHHHHTHDHDYGPGHNGPAGKAVQWQTPHLPHDHTHELPADPRKVDLDLVETAFIEGFSRAPDAVSFLRLSGIPFVGESDEGKRLHLLRVETEEMVDVGSVMPLLGGEGIRYDPLPAPLTSHRRRLAFVYHDGIEVRRLGFAEARALIDRTEASKLDMTAR